MNDMSTKTDAEFVVTLPTTAPIKPEDIVKTFKLTSYLSITNMNLFNHEEKLIHYDSVSEICDDFIVQRMNYYTKRRDYMINILNDEIDILKNKYTYILEIIDETIDLRKKTGPQIHKILVEKQYRLVDATYHYLIKMTMDSVTEENVTKLKKQYDDKIKELQIVLSNTIEQMWYKDLEELLKQL